MNNTEYTHIRVNGDDVFQLYMQNAFIEKLLKDPNLRPALLSEESVKKMAEKKLVSQEELSMLLQIDGIRIRMNKDSKLPRAEVFYARPAEQIEIPFAHLGWNEEQKLLNIVHGFYRNSPSFLQGRI